MDEKQKTAILLRLKDSLWGLTGSADRDRLINNPGSMLKHDLAMDSLDLVSFELALETDFPGFDFEPVVDRWNDQTTVGEVLADLDALLNKEKT